jgi:hypothetical protein
MEILLIDVGALAIFLGYVAIVYWHAVAHEAQPNEPRFAPGAFRTLRSER